MYNRIEKPNNPSRLTQQLWANLLSICGHQKSLSASPLFVAIAF
jgi:hypothetical protein